LRTVLPKPSQPIRYCARMVSALPVFSSRRPAVMPSPSSRNETRVAR
jgi:hypothetical protein